MILHCQCIIEQQVYLAGILCATCEQIFLEISLGKIVGKAANDQCELILVGLCWWDGGW